MGAILDSGERTEFAIGALRDMQGGKGAYDDGFCNYGERKGGDNND